MLQLFPLSENMRYPPDEWAIRLDNLFETTVGDDSISKLSAEVLVQVDISARINGCFKILLTQRCGYPQAGHPRGEHPHHGRCSHLQDQDWEEAPGYCPSDQCDYLQVALPDGKVKNSHKKIKNSPLIFCFTSVTDPYSSYPDPVPAKKEKPQSGSGPRRPLKLALDPNTSYQCRRSGRINSGYGSNFEFPSSGSRQKFRFHVDLEPTYINKYI